MADQKKLFEKFLVWIIPIFFVIVGFLTRYYDLKYPAMVIFDETYFGAYGEKYLSGQFYFDIHPPLGKLVLGAVADLAGAEAGFSFKLGETYKDSVYIWMRGVPAFFGSLLAVVVYLLVKEMGNSRRASFLAGFLVLFDNALLIQSRFILLDMILIFFVFLSFLLYFVMKKSVPLTRNWYFAAGLLGLSLGAACSIKWTGVGVFALIWFLLLVKERLLSKTAKEILSTGSLICVLPAVVYVAGFAAHFNLLPEICRTDCGYVMDKYYQGITPLEGSFFEKFLSTNLAMVNKGFDGDMRYYYESDWWSWPLMVRPLVYVMGEFDRGEAAISYFLIGNPIVWGLTLAAVIIYIYLLIRNAITGFVMRLPAVFYEEKCVFLLFGYFAYLLPFAFVPRFMVIYHYFPALIFGIMLAAVMIDALLNMVSSRIANGLFLGTIVFVLAAFIFFAPLTYGIPLDEEGFLARMWLPIWNYSP